MSKHMDKGIVKTMIGAKAYRDKKFIEAVKYYRDAVKSYTQAKQEGVDCQRQLKEAYINLSASLLSHIQLAIDDRSKLIETINTIEQEVTQGDLYSETLNKHLAYIYYELGLQAQKQASKKHEQYLNYVSQQERTQHLEQATNYFKQAKDKCQNDIDILYNLGLVLLKRESYKDAKEEFDRLLESNGTTLSPRYEINIHCKLIECDLEIKSDKNSEIKCKLSDALVNKLQRFLEVVVEKVDDIFAKLDNAQEDKKQYTDEVVFIFKHLITHYLTSKSYDKVNDCIQSINKMVIKVSVISSQIGYGLIHHAQSLYNDIHNISNDEQPKIIIKIFTAAVKIFGEETLINKQILDNMKVIRLQLGQHVIDKVFDTMSHESLDTHLDKQLIGNLSNLDYNEIDMYW